ncbi:hypothetical protein GCM10010156_73620 [Planobispora rosea]|uniref:Pentapeptide repeat-containing protein n=1 Tax=Planobispora rosea TaxID=35762 RepID=A0A8J3SBT1_PLARO|nr:pentapeptide repeat-containing protein [Planobispora rosea]GGT05137.1 hypothetical protein GCM10010156_73620 [Planobispora rosea]GIH88869.1 hypothetical protein Pro02_72770 [Planobispora rosea]
MKPAAADAGPTATSSVAVYAENLLTSGPVSAPAAPVGQTVADRHRPAGLHLAGADLARSHFSGADFTGAPLTSVNFFAAILTGIVFAHSLTSVDFSRATLKSVDFSEAALNSTGAPEQHRDTRRGVRRLLLHRRGRMED